MKLPVSHANREAIAIAAPRVQASSAIVCQVITMMLRDLLKLSWHFCIGGMRLLPLVERLGNLLGGIGGLVCRICRCGMVMFPRPLWRTVLVLYFR